MQAGSLGLNWASERSCNWSLLGAGIVILSTRKHPAGSLNGD